MALTALGLRNAAQHLLHMHAAACPSHLAALAAFHGSAHSFNQKYEININIYLLVVGRNGLEDGSAFDPRTLISRNAPYAQNGQGADVVVGLKGDGQKVWFRTLLMRTPEGPKTLTASQAVIWSIYQGAIAGKVSQQRLVLQWVQQAYEENVYRRPVLRNVDRLNLETGEMDGKPELEHWLLGLSALSKKT